MLESKDIHLSKSRADRGNPAETMASLKHENIRLKQELLKQNELLQLFSENSNEIISLHKQDGSYTYVGPSVKRVLGYTSSELIGQHFLDLLHPNDINQIEEIFRTLQSAGNLVTHTYRILHCNGTYLWLQSTFRSKPDSSGKFRHLIISSQDISAQKREELKLKETLHEKEVLLKEVYHRVKNNMQIILGLNNMQSKCIQDKNTLALLEENQNRVQAMSLIHDQFHRTTDLAELQFDQYIQNLVHQLITSLGRNNISYFIYAEPITLNNKQAVSCGLILNELITNALKHAFNPDQPGHITIKLRAKDQKYTILEVKDDGIGLPDGFDFNNTDSSLGMYLINGLVRQIGGEITISKNDKTSFLVKFATSN